MKSKIITLNSHISLLLIFFFCLNFHNNTFSQKSWTKDLAGIGTFSSPRVTDLNRDGIQDIVIGAGRLEFQACDSAIIAIDGANGNLLWNVSASDQMFGSAIFQDVTKDGIKDVFIGGRSAEFLGIDGANGKVLWRFLKSNETYNQQHQDRWFNFYNPQLIADQDGDGWKDILVSNGGDVLVEPHDANRPPGYLLILSAKTGKILSKAVMPDGKETYLSPIVLSASNNKNAEVVFGTGGETVGGNLFVASLADVKNEDLSNATRLDSSAIKGYIGPPVRVDINQDKILDIITSSVDGRLMAFDGKTKKRIWEVVMPNTESYSSITVGNFNQDKIPDMFVSYGQGVWPHLDWSIQVMVNGANGAIEFRDSLGYYQNTTPLAVDLNGDGLDEVIMSLNFQEVNEYYQKYFYNNIIAIEFKSKDVVNLTANFEGSNLSSTPWIGDLDGDGFLDMLYCHGINLRHTYTFDGMKLHRIATQIPISKKIKWGSYQGSNYDGIYRNED